jgi:hypothetical protein
MGGQIIAERNRPKTPHEDSTSEMHPPQKTAGPVFCSGSSSSLHAPLCFWVYGHARINGVSGRRRADLLVIGDRKACPRRDDADVRRPLLSFHWPAVQAIFRLRLSVAP